MGQAGHTPGGAPAKVFMFIGFSFPRHEQVDARGLPPFIPIAPHPGRPIILGMDYHPSRNDYTIHLFSFSEM